MLSRMLLEARDSLSPGDVPEEAIRRGGRKNALLGGSTAPALLVRSTASLPSVLVSCLSLRMHSLLAAHTSHLPSKLLHFHLAIQSLALVFLFPFFLPCRNPAYPSDLSRSSTAAPDGRPPTVGHLWAACHPFSAEHALCNHPPHLAHPVPSHPSGLWSRKGVFLGLRAIFVNAAVAGREAAGTQGPQLSTSTSPSQPSLLISTLWCQIWVSHVFPL